MRVGDEIAFWWGGEIHIGVVSHASFYRDAAFVQSGTIDHSSVLVREEDIIEDEDCNDG